MSGKAPAQSSQDGAAITTEKTVTHNSHTHTYLAYLASYLALTWQLYHCLDTPHFILFIMCVYIFY